MQNVENNKNKILQNKSIKTIYKHKLILLIVESEIYWIVEKNDHQPNGALGTWSGPVT